MPKKPPPDGGKNARKKADEDLTKAHKGDDVGGSLRALGRLIRGK